MLATPGALPDGPEWVFEVKWDGMRLLADVADGRVRLSSRSERDVTANFPELAALTDLAPDVLLDGEVVLLENGVPSFAALADRMHGPVAPRIAQTRPVTFMVFDVLRLYGVPLFDRPFAERRGTLERLDLASIPVLSLSPTYTDGAALLEVTRQRGMEGVVAKRRDGVYRPGRRSPTWTKVTHRHSQACLVGGWRPERSSANRIGAVLLASPLLLLPITFTALVALGWAHPGYAESAVYVGGALTVYLASSAAERTRVEKPGVLTHAPA